MLQDAFRLRSERRSTTASSWGSGAGNTVGSCMTMWGVTMKWKLVRGNAYNYIYIYIYIYMYEHKYMYIYIYIIEWWSFLGTKQHFCRILVFHCYYLIYIYFRNDIDNPITSKSTYSIAVIKHEIIGKQQLPIMWLGNSLLQLAPTSFLVAPIWIAIAS